MFIDFFEEHTYLCVMLLTALLGLIVIIIPAYLHQTRNTYFVTHAKLYDLNDGLDDEDEDDDFDKIEMEDDDE